MARAELDQLLDALIPFAQQQLAKRAEFYPFGGSVGLDGSVTTAMAYLEGEQIDSQTAIDQLLAGFRQRRSELSAIGICFDSRVRISASGTVGDAICVQLEHRDGEAVTVYVPYQKRRLRGIEYGDLFGSHGECRVFS